MLLDRLFPSLRGSFGSGDSGTSETTSSSRFHPLEEVSEGAPSERCSPQAGKFPSLRGSFGRLETIRDSENIESFHPLEEVSEGGPLLYHETDAWGFHPLEEVSEAPRVRTLTLWCPTFPSLRGSFGSGDAGLKAGLPEGFHPLEEVSEAVAEAGDAAAKLGFPSLRGSFGRPILPEELRPHRLVSIP